MRDLARLYAESEAAGFGISYAEFADFLTDEAANSPVRLKELVLARACARGNPSAWEYFVAQYRQKLHAAAVSIAHDEVRGRELADSLYAELYGTRVLDGVNRVSKLNSFQGRGSLEGWLKTLLAQEYVNRFRRQRKLVAFNDALEIPCHPEELADASQQSALACAIDAALTDLREEDRFLLSAYYLDERTLAEVGRMLGMHESTVSRRIEKMTARLRKEILRRLCQSGVPKRAAEEMLAIDVRDLAIDVREKLAQERRA